MIDAHLHLVDFVQTTMDPTDLARVLEERGVVGFGLPVKKKWALTEPQRPTYYLDDNAPCGAYSLTDEMVASLAAGLPAALRPRLAPLICGFDPTDLLAVDHVERMIERHDCWRGIGEVLLRHDDLTELTYGENARAGHPALDPILEICAGRGWPMLVHQDVSSAGRVEDNEYVDELVGMVARHPRVPVVWAHAGVSRRIQPTEHAALVRDLMSDHSNLHLDLSWALYEVAAEDGALSQPWERLLTRFPERFVVGSDVFGQLEGQPAALDRWVQALDRLPASVRAAVEDDNARRIYWEG